MRGARVGLRLGRLEACEDANQGTGVVFPVGDCGRVAIGAVRVQLELGDAATHEDAAADAFKGVVGDGVGVGIGVGRTGSRGEDVHDLGLDEGGDVVERFAAGEAGDFGGFDECGGGSEPLGVAVERRFADAVGEDVEALDDLANGGGSRLMMARSICSRLSRGMRS